LASTITWQNAVSADWTVGTDWTGGIAPTLGDTVVLAVPGAYDVTVAAGETITALLLAQSTGTLTVDGQLRFSSTTGTNTIAAGATLDGGGAFNTGGILSISNTLLNQGVIDADVANQYLQLNTTGFLNNQGTLMASNVGQLYVFTHFFNNLSAGTLTGGSYVVLGASSGTDAQIGIAPGGNGDGRIVVDAATITLSGAASRIIGLEAGTTIYDALEATLTSIDTAGVLNLLDARGYGIANAANTLTVSGLLYMQGGAFPSGTVNLTASGTFAAYGVVNANIANAGTVEAKGGFLTLTGSLSDTGTIKVDPNASLALSGTRTAAIIDNGTVVVEASGGALKLSGVISGTGGFLLDVPATSTGGSTTLELATATSAPVAFDNAGTLAAKGVLKIDTPASFHGAISGFGTGDTIDLAGIGAATTAALSGNTLIVKSGAATLDTLAFAGSTAGAVFTAGTDGSGGTKITVAGLTPISYAFEGPYWQSKTITWSFASNNFAADSATPYSSFITQTAYQAVVEQAFARWAAIEGFNFVYEPTDSAAVDIRVGWGNFVGSGGEIGQAAYSYSGTTLSPDAIVRIQDPTGIALVANAGVIGGYAYSGLSSTLYQIALHEIGHALGLDHSGDPHAVMNPTAQGVTNQDADASDIAGIQALYAAVACYASGTRILTTQGEIPVEALRVGQLVPGRGAAPPRRIRWIGHRTLDPRGHPRPHDVQPVRIRAGAFGPLLPRRDLRLSPDHAVFLRGGLTPVRYLVNGATVRQERVRRVTYWHVELETPDGEPVHDVLLAEGLPAESFLDTGNRAAFEGGGAALDLHPDFARGVWQARGFAPLHTSGANVIALRTRLLDRAAALGMTLTDDPGLAVQAGAENCPPLGRQENTWCFDVPAGKLRLRSRATVPDEVRVEGGDRRRLGVAIAALSLDGAPIALDDSRLGVGFEPIERNGTAAWRWTNGDAALHIDRPGRLTVGVVMTLPYWRRPASRKSAPVAARG
jgi:predicted Zn-dependent protease